MTTLAKKVGVIYRSDVVNQVLAASIVYNAYGVSGDLVDVYGVTESNVAIAIAALGATTYDYVLVAPVIDGGGTSKVDRSDIDIIVGSKLTAATTAAALVTPIRTVQTIPTQTEIGVGTSAIQLDGAASSDDDAYNRYVLKFIPADAAVQYRYIYDYDGTTKIASVGTAVTGTIAGGTFLILDYTDYVIECNTADITNITATTGGKTAEIVAHELIHSGNGIPFVIRAAARYKYFLSHGTAQAANGTTVTLLETVDAADVNSQTLHDTLSIYNNKYLYIMTSTLGRGAVKKVTSYVGSTNVATVPTFTTTPTGTIVYGIVEKEWMVKIPEYVRMYVMSHLTSVTTPSVAFSFKKLYDDNNELATEGGVGTSKYNKTFYNEVITLGQGAYEAYMATLTTP